MLINRLVKRQPYAIPDSLNHSSGTITAIMGGVTYNVSLTGLAANNLYFLYLSGSTPALSFSTTVPSTFRTTTPDALLIGAFYANGLSPVAFGSFVNIEGDPTSEWLDYTGTVTASPTPPTKGTISTEKWKWRRVGDTIDMFWDTVYTSAGTAGSGQYLHSLPANLAIDLTKLGAGGNFVNFHCGTFSINTSGVSTSIGYMIGITSTQLGAVTYNGNILGSSFSPYSAAAFNFSFRAIVPISGFSNKPLKDL